MNEPLKGEPGEAGNGAGGRGGEDGGGGGGGGSRTGSGGAGGRGGSVTFRDRLSEPALSRFERWVFRLGAFSGTALFVIYLTRGGSLA